MLPRSFVSWYSFAISLTSSTVIKNSFITLRRKRIKHQPKNFDIQTSKCVIIKNELLLVFYRIRIKGLRSSYHGKAVILLIKTKHHNLTKCLSAHSIFFHSFSLKTSLNNIVPAGIHSPKKLISNHLNTYSSS